MSLWVEI